MKYYSLIIAFLFNIILHHAFGCMPIGYNDEVTIGEDTYVCITLSPMNWYKNGTYIRIAAQPRADQLSRINIPNSWTSSNYTVDELTSRLNIDFTSRRGIGVTLTSLNKVTYQKAYRYVYDTTGSTFPMLMAVISVDNGKITGIEWDDNCKWCGEEDCLHNTFDFRGYERNAGRGCRVLDSTCATPVTTESPTNQLCELNIYFAWTGSDSKGNVLQSAAARFSRMTEAQLVEYTDSLANNNVAVE